jgi:hypothetical protein
MADKDFYQKQEVSVPWYVVVPLWVLAIGSWFTGVWISELVQTVQSAVLR